MRIESFSSNKINLKASDKL